MSENRCRQRFVGVGPSRTTKEASPMVYPHWRDTDSRSPSAIIECRLVDIRTLEATEGVLIGRTCRVYGYTKGRESESHQMRELFCQEPARIL